jgi:hypothetical protein
MDVTLIGIIIIAVLIVLSIIARVVKSYLPKIIIGFIFVAIIICFTYWYFNR